MIVHDKLYIGGDWVTPAGPGTIEVISPATEQPVGRVPDGTAADIDAAVAAARAAFDEGPWPQMAPAERADVVERFANLYASKLDEMASLITLEMGSPKLFSQLAQAPMPLMMLNYFVGLAREFPFEQERQGMLGKLLVRCEPVGVVGAIVPWNVPQFTTMSKVAPALVAGCTVVVKPSPETPLDAFLMAQLAHEAGLPAGVLNVVPAGREVGEHLVTHPGVDKISFTGSTAAGRRIASLCGQNLTRCSLELGGKSAAIILDDADLSKVTEGLKMASFMNNGQACVAQTRILAPRSRYDDVVEALAELANGFRIGDPSDATTEIGPLVSSRQRERVEGYIKLGQEEGAKAVAGGARPAGLDKGWYVEPTVFAGVDNRMRVAQEEIFGPVLVAIPYDGEADAIRIANDSDYGLAGTVWTSDTEHGIDVARRVRTGSYGVNGYLIDPATPFGGYKASGIGREFGPEGFAAYLEYKSIALPA